MTQADSVHSTPPTNTSAPLELAAESGEVAERGFPSDTSDEYVMTEREPDGDELDASYPESGVKPTSPMEDDEAGGDEDEPSLGSIEDHPNGYYDGSDASGWRRSQERWAAGNRDDCEGDEHDGREPENEGGEAVKEDDEPSLGWTVDGCMTGRDDREHDEVLL